MRQQEIAEALAYLYWMRDRIAAAAGQLSEAQFRSDVPSATRSLRGTLAHQLECEWAWRIRLTTGAFPDEDVFAPEDFASAGALAERWREEEQAVRTWIATLTDDALAARPPGDGNTLARWRYLAYVVNHGTQQFSEAAVLLTRMSCSPGEIGYLEFCMQQSNPSR